MKKKHNSRNIQHLDKLNSLSKEVLLSGRYIQDNNSNNTGENSKKVLTSFELTKTKSNFLNPLFKQKLFDVYSEIAPRNKTLSPTRRNNSYYCPNKNIKYENNNILNDEKRVVLNMKKNEILYLLNPFNSKFHLEKEKIKIKNKKKRSIDFKRILNTGNNDIKFPDKIRNEINRILSKNELSRNNIFQKNEKTFSESPKLRYKVSHKRNYSSIFH